MNPVQDAHETPENRRQRAQHTRIFFFGKRQVFEHHVLVRLTALSQRVGGKNPKTRLHPPIHHSIACEPGLLCNHIS